MMSRTKLSLAAAVAACALSLSAGGASAQSTTVNDICMAPRFLTMADPYSPVSVNCLSQADVTAAKAALRAKATPAYCKSVAPRFLADPYAPETVTCNTDVQIRALVTKIKQPLPAGVIDDTCMRAADALKNDTYSGIPVRCYPEKVINDVAVQKKAYVAATLAAQRASSQLANLYSSKVDPIVLQPKTTLSK